MSRHVRFRRPPARAALVSSLLVGVAALAATGPVAAFPPAANGRLAFDRNDQIITANPDGTNVQLLAPAGCCATWSPDGSKLAVVDLTEDGRFTFALVNPDGTGRTPPMPIEMPGLHVGADAWAPDGIWVAGEGVGDRDPNLNGIYLRRAADGGGLTELLSTPFQRIQPGDFSPDGSQLVFVLYQSLDESGKRAIFVIGRDGLGLRQVTPWGMAGCCTASWSPDGKWIVFDDQGRLFLVHPDGTGLRQVRVHPGGRYFAFEPDWSPDGTRIAFSMYVVRLGQDDIYTVDPDGTDLDQVTDTPDHEGQVDWGTAPAG
jgi:TolB protein